MGRNDIIKTDGSLDYDTIGSYGDKLADIMTNVKYPSIPLNGAKGDGVTDDTTNIQSVLDSLTNGGTIYFPDGNYIKSGVLTIKYPNINIVFAPNAKITDTIKGKNGFIVNSGLHDILFNGVRLYGCSDSTEPVAYAIRCNDNSHDITFKDCRFDGYTGGLLYNYLNYNMVCHGCKFYNMIYVPSVSAGGYGIVFQASYNTRTINNYFDGSVERHHLYVGRNPVNVDPKGYNHVISGNIFIGESKSSYTTGFEYRVKVMGDSDVSIIGNVFSGGVGHILFSAKGTTDQDPKNITITGNTFSNISKGDSSNSWCMGFDGSATAENVIIQGNVIKDCDCNAGIKFSSGVSVIVANNSIINLTSGHGIMSEFGLVDSMIIGNNIKNTTGRGIYLAYSYSAGNECNNLAIRNNEIKSTTFGIYLNAILSGIIENNNILGTTYQCLYFSNVKFVGTIRNNTFNGGNYAIYFNAESTDPIYFYGNVFKNQSQTQFENQGNAFLIEPINNGVNNTSLLRGNVKCYGATAPTTSHWIIGDRFINKTPTVGQPKSWVCTVSGTPGTWVSEGNL